MLKANNLYAWIKQLKADTIRALKEVDQFAANLGSPERAAMTYDLDVIILNLDRIRGALTTR